MMNRLIASLTAAAVLGLSQGCAVRPPDTPPAAAANPAPGAASLACAGPQCASQVMQIAQRTEVPKEKDAPQVKDHPLTSVVVTQCNLIVAVYMTMEDGRLLRFDHSSTVPADQLLQMAYTATRSERVEVSCHEQGAVGYEKHDPV
jgi:hypothetical protein